MLPVVLFAIAFQATTAHAAEPDEANECITELEFGQLVSVRQGATYYESADQNGSGKQGLCGCNIYTEGDIYIAGYAQLDQNGNIIKNECYQRDNVPHGKKCDFDLSANVWIALYVEGFTTGDIGWVRLSDVLSNSDARDLMLPTEDVVTPKDVANAIEQAQDSGKSTALLLDASGSVYEYSAEIAAYATQVNKADKVLVFADDYMEIEAEDYLESWMLVGGGTEIYATMNALSGEDYDVVIIVTDTYQNGYIELEERNGIGEVIIVSVEDEYLIQQSTIEKITEKWHIKPQIVRLSVG